MIHISMSVQTHLSQVIANLILSNPIICRKNKKNHVSSNYLKTEIKTRMSIWSRISDKDNLELLVAFS